MPLMNVKAAWTAFSSCWADGERVKLDDLDRAVFYSGAMAMFRIIHNIAESHDGAAREILIAALVIEMAGAE